MSALTCWQGLEQVFRTIDGLRGVMLAEPTGDMDLPCLYTAYQSFDRPLRNSPPARNVTGMHHIFACRLVIRFVDNAQCEMQLLTLLDAIPDAIDLDPKLGGRVNSGMAYCGSGRDGFRADRRGVVPRGRLSGRRVRQASKRWMIRSSERTTKARIPTGCFLPGVPLADIEQSRWTALPDWLKASADAIGWYSAGPAARSARKAKED